MGVRESGGKGVKTVISNRLTVIGKVAPKSEPEPEPAPELVIPDVTPAA